MTEEQRLFIERINHYLKDVEYFSVGGGCDREGCGEDSEAFFSWSACEACGSTLGGDRYAAHGCIDGNVVHFHICTDCLFYHANGELPGY